MNISYLKFLLLSLLSFSSVISVAIGGPDVSNSSVPDQSHSHSTKSLLPLPLNYDTVLMAGPDGTIYLVEINRGKVLWSFKSGPSIYSSYQDLPLDVDKHNASRQRDNFFIDVGDDRELYMHGKDLKEVKLPYLSAADGIMLGTKKTTIYLVDEKSGKVIHNFRSDDLSSSGGLGTEEIDQPLYKKRQDYGLKHSSSKTGKVQRYLMLADIEASYLDQGVDNVSGGTPSKGFEFGAKYNGDIELPVHCQGKPFVYRVRDHRLLETLSSDGFPNSLKGF